MSNLFSNVLYWILVILTVVLLYFPLSFRFCDKGIMSSGYFCVLCSRQNDWLANILNTMKTKTKIKLVSDSINGQTHII